MFSRKSNKSPHNRGQKMNWKYWSFSYSCALFRKRDKQDFQLAEHSCKTNRRTPSTCSSTLKVSQQYDVRHIACGILLASSCTNQKHGASLKQGQFSPVACQTHVIRGTACEFSVMGGSRPKKDEQLRCSIFTRRVLTSCFLLSICLVNGSCLEVLPKSTLA